MTEIKMTARLKVDTKEVPFRSEESLSDYAHRILGYAGVVNYTLTGFVGFIRKEITQTTGQPKKLHLGEEVVEIEFESTKTIRYEEQ